MIDDKSELSAEAARWVMRQDRGLSPAEQDDFLRWLAADSSRPAAIREARTTWQTFDRLAGIDASIRSQPDPDLLAPETRRRTLRRRMSLLLPLAAAATLAVIHLAEPPDVSAPAADLPPPGTIALLPPIEERTLEDGSVLRLNRGTAVFVTFDAAERRVRMDHGEASFVVARDTTRPFVVETAGASFRAVGTAFNVRIAARDVELIVTEGRVAVLTPPLGEVPSPELPALAAGQRAVVPLEPGGGGPQIDAPGPEELARRLAWQPRILTFTDEPLSAIIGEFNRHNPLLLRLADPAMQDLRLTARFRSDNVDGFLRLLASDFGVRADRTTDGAVVLRPQR